MGSYIGDILAAATITHMWSSSGTSGASITRGTNGTVRVYKNSSTTESTTGVTDTEDYDALTGVHHVSIDTSADGTFYAAANDFHVVLSGASIDGLTVNSHLFSFSIENRTQKADVRKVLGTAATAATAGILDVNAKRINDVATTSVTTINANVGTTQPVNFTGTGASALAKSDMVDIAGAAVSTSTAQLGVNVIQAAGTAWGSGAITAASIATDAITAAKIAADAIGASELAADAVTEIQSGLSTLTAAGVRTAVGLATANLDTQLAAIALSADSADSAATDASATATIINGRIGAPVGASISADIAAVKTDTGNLVTRITSTLFSGITSLGQWLGLIAGKQVGNTTARTELRATGAGSGTYDETTDSQEAMKDAGVSVSASDIRAAIGMAAADLDTQLDAIAGTIASVGGVPGSGADEVTVNVKVAGVNVADADVWVTSDSAGTTVVAGTLQTNSSGNATFMLDAGSTYYLWAQKDGINAIQGQSFTAVAD